MMANQEERRLILDMIANHKITAEEGLHLLQSLPADEEDEAGAENQAESLEAFQPDTTALPSSVGLEDQPPAEGQDTGADESQSDADQAAKAAPSFTRWRHFWMIPLWIGTGVTVAGALLMVWAQQASGMGFWFFCAGVPFTLGIVLIALAWQTRSAPWLHLRVQQKPGEHPQKIAISLPLPLGISSWFLRTFRHRIPGMDDVSIDEILTALQQSTSPDNPLYIEVEEEDGERVQIFIG